MARSLGALLMQFQIPIPTHTICGCRVTHDTHRDINVHEYLEDLVITSSYYYGNNIGWLVIINNPVH